MIWTLLACSGSCAGDKPPPEGADEVGPAAFDEVRFEPLENALIIVVDTLRADVLREVDTPHMDSLDQRVDRAWAAGTWTVPSVVSLFTGASVREHGFDLPTGRIGKYPQLPALPTLAEVLKQQGFTTTGLYSNGYLAQELGFDRGFDTWRRVSDTIVADRFRKTVEQTWTHGGRDFAYLHLLGPHSPLKPSEASREKYAVDPEWFDPRMGLEIGVAKRNRREGAREAYAQAYRAVVEDTDLIIGELLAALGEHRKDTLIVLTSDHGELLGERDIVGHGYWVWEPLTQVPLRLEGHQGELPATFGLAGLADLVTWNLGLDHSWPSSRDQGTVVSQREGKLALLDGQYKGVWHQDSFAVYDLQADELTPVADPGLAALREQWEASTPQAEPLTEVVELEPETVESLQELGYIE